MNMNIKYKLIIVKQYFLNNIIVCLKCFDTINSKLNSAIIIKLLLYSEQKTTQ